MEQTRQKIEAEKRRLRAEYGSLFDSVASILFKHDPAGINFEDNSDEYEPEARTILPKLKACQSVEDVMSVMHEEFRRWFDNEIAGPKETYRKIAEEIWDSWQKRQSKLGQPDAS